jgi:hypothetical protein
MSVKEQCTYILRLKKRNYTPCALIRLVLLCPGYGAQSLESTQSSAHRHLEKAGKCAVRLQRNHPKCVESTPALLNKIGEDSQAGCDTSGQDRDQGSYFNEFKELLDVFVIKAYATMGDSAPNSPSVGCSMEARYGATVNI